ncbi:DedA family protein [Pseudonocardia bannensis]|uniref:DedA family protein n=1 Tax=Pseudonocardia bannensis TaxID=630973 RepID=A0A848DJC9_9PSEU|nr:DedA family protein [Pseudonocardia bannensis]NMH92636.1 DedA family protein [Pseudonocardia bannensis]
MTTTPALAAATSNLAAGPLQSAGPVTVWLVVLTFVFLECAFIVGLFLPGDSLLIAAGVVLAQHGHEAGAWSLAISAAVVAVVGNQVGYLVGRYTGTKILARKDGRILNRANLERAGRFFERWGFWSIVVARWVPWVRTLAPMIAGAARMDNRRYILANAVGAVLWVPTLMMLGYYGAGLLDSIPWLKTASAVGAIGFFVIGTGYGLFRYWQEMRRPVDTDEPLPEDELVDRGAMRDGRR